MPSSAGRVQRATNIMRAAVGIGRRQVGRGVERMGNSVANQQDRSRQRSLADARQTEAVLAESRRYPPNGNTRGAQGMWQARADGARGRARGERRNAQRARAVAEVGRRMSRR